MDCYVQIAREMVYIYMSDVAFDVNIRLVLLAHELGLGYAAQKKITVVKC